MNLLDLEVDLTGVVTAASKNKSLKHLILGRNLQSTKAKHVAQVMDSIVQMLQEDDCVLQTLSLADSKLKGELFSVINAIGSNQTLQNIDIRCVICLLIIIRIRYGNWSRGRSSFFSWPLYKPVKIRGLLYFLRGKCRNPHLRSLLY